MPISRRRFEFELFVAPVVVGGGTPYFPPDVHVDLELVETRNFGGTVYLHYRRRGGDVSRGFRVVPSDEP